MQQTRAELSSKGSIVVHTETKQAVLWNGAVQWHGAQPNGIKN
jgi:hypothetical protein